MCVNASMPTRHVIKRPVLVTPVFVYVRMCMYVVMFVAEVCSDTGSDISV